MTKNSHDSGLQPEGYETRDVSTRLVLWAGAGLTLLVVASSIAMLWFFDVLDRRETRSQPQLSPLARSSQEQPPEPRLQALPRKDLAEVVDQQDRILSSYGWVDEGAGIARIPIGRAIEIVATRGVPPRTRPAATEKKP
jgi:hypothetical protein